MPNEARSTRYHRLRRRSAAGSAAAAAALYGGLLASGGSVALRDLARRMAAAAGLPAAPDSLPVVLLVVSVLAIAHALVELPFAVYRGFFLERRYGLSRETLGRWAAERLKADAISFVFGVAAAAILYTCLRERPADGWLWASVIFAGLAVALAHAAPVVLLPLFAEVRPLDREALRTRLEALARRAGSRAVGVYTWHVGDRTRRANAALVGVGSTRRILLSETLLADYSDDEIEAILAHELAHHVRHDLWRMLAYETFVVGASLFSVHRALARLGPWADLSGPADAAGVPLVALVLGLVWALQLPLANALSRRAERRADRCALWLTGRPQAFASAMRRLAVQNLAETSPPALVRWVLSSHPPIDERIAAAEAASGERA